MKANRIIVVVSAVITFLLASTGLTAVYWVAGGSFERGAPLAVYLLVEFYLALLVINVAKKRPEQIAKEVKGE